MYYKTWLFLALFSLLYAFQCDKKQLGELSDTSWKLAAITQNGVTDKTPDSILVTLKFSGDEIQGNGGCNAYGGKFTASDDGVLSITDVFATEKYCPGASGFENRYMEQLTKSTSFTRLGGDLEILTPEAKLTFVIH